MIYAVFAEMSAVLTVLVSFKLRLLCSLWELRDVHFHQITRVIRRFYCKVKNSHINLMVNKTPTSQDSKFNNHCHVHEHNLQGWVCVRAVTLLARGPGFNPGPHHIKHIIKMVPGAFCFALTI